MVLLHLCLSAYNWKRRKTKPNISFVLGFIYFSFMFISIYIPDASFMIEKVCVVSTFLLSLNHISKITFPITYLTLTLSFLFLTYLKLYRWNLIEILNKEMVAWKLCYGSKQINVKNLSSSLYTKRSPK